MFKNFRFRQVLTKYVRCGIFGIAAIIVLTAIAAGQESAPLRLVQTIRLPNVEGRIDHFALDAQGQRLFLAALGNNSVEVIDLKAGKVVQTIRGLDEPQGIGYVAGAKKIFVANGGDGSVRVFDGDSYRLLDTLTFSGDADNIRYDPASKRIYVGYASGFIGIVDASTGKRLGDIKLEAHPESFQLEKSGPKIFVNVPHAGHIAVVDRGQQKVIAKWPVGDAHANFPMALDDKDHRLFVVCRKPAELSVFDTESGKQVASVPVAGDADDVFYDAARHQIYVSGGEGFISIIKQRDKDRYKAVAKIETASGARTSFFAPELGHLYLAVPGRGDQKPEIRVYETQPSVAQGQENHSLRRGQTIALPNLQGGFNHMSVDAEHQRLYVAAPTNKTLEVLDLASGRPIASMEGEKPAAARYAPEFNQLYVPRGQSLYIYDGKTLDLITSIDLQSGLDELQYDARAKELYVGVMNVDKPGIAVISIPDGKLLAKVSLPGKPQGVTFEQNGKRIFANVPSMKQIAVIDRKKRVLLDPWPTQDVQGNSPIGLDEERHRLFVGARNPAQLIVVNTDNGKTVATVDGSRDADDLFYDPANKRVYISCGEGFVDVIEQRDADHYRMLKHIPTVAGARTSTFSAQLNAFYLGVPQHGVEPAKILVFKTADWSDAR